MPFLTLLLNNWRWIGLALAVALPMGWAAIQTSRLNGCQERYTSLRSEFEGFRREVEAHGRIAEQKAKEREATDKAAKEKADAEYAKNLAALHNDIGRLRRERDAASSARRIVPAAAATAADPARACFDAAALEREIRSALDRVRERLRGLVDEGAAAQVGLDGARRWAQGQP